MNNNTLQVGAFNLNSSALIEASAGTGKTYTITYLVLRLLLGSQGFYSNESESAQNGDLHCGYSGGPLELKNILVVTFTNAAASDLKARIREKIIMARNVFDRIAHSDKGVGLLDELDVEDQMKGLVLEMCENRGIKPRMCALILLNAERSIDEAAICTIHSFCTSALHKIYTFEAGEAFDVELAEDTKKQLTEAVNGVFRELFYKGDKTAEVIAALLEREKNSGLKEVISEVIHRKLSKIRNTDPKDGTFGYCLKNAVSGEKRNVLKAVEELKKLILDSFEKVKTELGTLKNLYDNNEVIAPDGTAGAMFSKSNGSAPAFKKEAAASAKAIAALIKNPDDISLYLGSEITGGINAISRVTKREDYGKTFCHRDEVIDFEDGCTRLSDLKAEIFGYKAELLIDLAVLVSDKLDEIFRRDRIIDFDGIIRRLDFVLNCKEGSRDMLPSLIRSKYPVAMIDEFQDTDPVQFSIFRKLYLNEEARSSSAFCYLIGDPKQSIYGFRRADINSYLKARALIEDLYGKDSIYTLSTNYRSQEQIVEGVNCIFSVNKNPFFFDEGSSQGRIDYSPVDAKVNAKTGSSGKYSFRFDSSGTPEQNFATQSNYVELYTSKEIADSEKVQESSKGNKGSCRKFTAQKVARAIKSCLAHGILDKAVESRIVSRPVKPSDIAVLVRTGDESALVMNALKELGIPSVYYSDDSKVYQPDSSPDSVYEYDLIYYLMEAMDDYANRGKVRRLLFCQLCAGSFDSTPDDSSASLEQEVALLKKCRGIWEKNGFYPAFSTWSRDPRHNCLTENLKVAGGERTVTNLWHLAELLQTAWVHEHGIQAQLRWYSSLVKDGSDSQGDALRKRLESEASQVSIYTIFKSKGLEFPLVFMPFIWTDLRVPTADDAFYYDDKEGRLYFDLKGSDETMQQKKNSVLQEDARLLYVALTRACAANFFYICQQVGGVANAFAREFNEAGTAMKDCFEKAHEFFSADSIDLNASHPADGKDTKAASAESSETSVKPESIIYPSKSFRIVDDDFYENIESAGTAPAKTADKPDYEFCVSEFPDNFYGIRQNFKISSYSGIVARIEDGEHTHTSPVSSDSIDHTVFTRFNFPRNATAGTFLHSMMEYCSFPLSLDEAARERCIDKAIRTPEGVILNRWRYQNMPTDTAKLKSEKVKALSDWLLDIVSARMPCADKNVVRFCDLKKGDWLTELEFLFPSENFNTENLISLRKQNAALFAQEKGIDISTMDFALARNVLSGFVTGFIDLTFKTGDGADAHYYVLDYKSNFIGPDASYYDEKSVALNMLEHCYDVQYLFYSLALHRFLMSRIDNYSYEKNFGGIIYAYLRGMQKDSGNSVIYTRPRQDIIEKLSAIFGERRVVA
ncbi:MAG: UvrD-helicase domain-containing protein [Succinivibrio sp.]|nr:UvrD-helicase domain-containing protein [Succinivibrio sp.]